MTFTGLVGVATLVWLVIGTALYLSAPSRSGTWWTGPLMGAFWLGGLLLAYAMLRN